MSSRAKQFDSVAPMLIDKAPARILPTSSAAVAAASVSHPAVAALRQHWPEYLMEGAELGTFMISACLFGAILQLPGSPVVKGIPDPTLRRVLMGIAMAVTALAIIHSPFGKQSGAHLNPSVTLTFLRLGKVQSWDALFYMAAQFAGGIAGVLFIGFFIGNQLAHPAVNYVVTVPGEEGPLAAFGVEALIAFITMSVVLHSANHPRWSKFTGYFVAILIALYISVIAPISGMSMNPARTVGSAASAHLWTAVWLYFTAPPLGMLAAAELYLLRKGHGGVFCAKLHHHNDMRCIFHCRFDEMKRSTQVSSNTNPRNS